MTRSTHPAGRSRRPLALLAAVAVSAWPTPGLGQDDPPAALARIERRVRDIDRESRGQFHLEVAAILHDLRRLKADLARPSKPAADEDWFPAARAALAGSPTRPDPRAGERAKRDKPDAPRERPKSVLPDEPPKAPDLPTLPFALPERKGAAAILGELQRPAGEKPDADEATPAKEAKGNKEAKGARETKATAGWNPFKSLVERLAERMKAGPPPTPAKPADKKK
jgi:hypothetical protein